MASRKFSWGGFLIRLVAALVLVPEGADFNDDLVALGPHALAARVGPWLVR